VKPEARLWTVMRDKMFKPGVDRYDRIENALLSVSGQPDVNGCLEGEDVWIELKAPTEPKRDDTPLLGCSANHELLQSQMNWMTKQKQAGGIAFVLIRTDKRLMLVDGTKYATGQHFNRYTVNQMIHVSLFHVTLPMKTEDWRLLRNVIFTASRYRRLHQHASAQQLLNDLERGEEAMAGRGDARRQPSVASKQVTPGRARGGGGGARGGGRAGPIRGA
jgi:hypothetical protein